ncbi:MAG: hypothetical protein PVH00_14535 [Gemmatimonadota bacterium]|jgi:hypothetical protein
MTTPRRVGIVLLESGGMLLMVRAVARNGPAVSDGRVAWSVFDARGVRLGDVTFPDRFRLLEVGDGWTLGRFTDNLDVQHVRLHRVLRP